MSVLNTFIDQAQAFRVARLAGAARQLVESKSVVNTYVSPKERARRKKRKQIAKQSRLRNRH
jgi:hypothetical protein